MTNQYELPEPHVSVKKQTPQNKQTMVFIKKWRQAFALEKAVVRAVQYIDNSAAMSFGNQLEIR